MKKFNILLVFMSIQPFFSLKAQVPSDAIDVISKYYSDFTTEYDHKGQYKMLSNYYQPNFSYSLFELTYHTYDSKNKPIKNTVKFDFKKVISIQPYGGDMVTIHGTTTEQIPVALRIGFKIKEEIITVPIYVEDEDDITQTPIYKAFDTIWKYHLQTKINQRNIDEINERLKMEKNAEWPKLDKARIGAEKKKHKKTLITRNNRYSYKELTTPL